jgi:hypothetical protein
MSVDDRAVMLDRHSGRRSWNRARLGVVAGEHIFEVEGHEGGGATGLRMRELPEIVQPMLRQTLNLLPRLTGPCEDPWWIVGSAAMTLIGLQGLEVTDVDLIMTPQDARRVLAAVDLPNQADGGAGHARSDVFGRIVEHALPIEIMGGLQLRGDEGWRRVEPQTREIFRLDTGPIYTPSAQELRELTLASGRPKDLVRARALGERLLRGQGTSPSVGPRSAMS